MKKKFLKKSLSMVLISTMLGTQTVPMFAEESTTISEQDLGNFIGIEKPVITNINQLPKDFVSPTGDYDDIEDNEVTLETETGKVTASLEEPIVTYDTGESTIDIETANSENESAKISDNSSVEYTDEEAGITQSTTLFEDGMQLTYEIETPDSDHTIKTKFIDSESPLELMQDNAGFYKVVNDKKETVLDIGYPWAIDKAGNLIETEYKLDGNTLTQQIARQKEEAYPLKADPVICSPGADTIDNTATKYNSPTLSVYPRSCARNYITAYWVLSPLSLASFAASRMASDMWAEVMADASMQNKNSTQYKRRQRLEDQFICHAINPMTVYKSSWNLDTNRKDVSLVETYGYGCNPPKE